MKDPILNSSYAFLLEYCEEHNLDISTYLEGSGLSISKIREFGERSSLQSYNLILENIASKFDSSQLEELFLGTVMAKEHSYFRNLYNGLVAPELLYWSYAKFLGKHFINCFDFKYEKVSPNKVIVIVSVEAGLEVNPLAFKVYESVFRVAPRVIGHKDSIVNARYEDDCAYFEVHLQSVGNFGTKLMRLVNFPYKFQSWVKLLSKVLTEKDSASKENAKLQKFSEALELQNKKIEKVAQENILFTRFLVHDLKNSLFVANHFVKKSKQECIESGHDVRNFEKAQRAIDTVIETLERAKELEATEVDIQSNITGFNLKEALEETIENMCFMANDKSISINLDCEDNNIVLHSDRMLLIRSVFENILTNAIKFSFDDSQINILVNIPETKNDFIEVIVEDSGIGIPVHFLEHLFTTSEKTVSTGTHGERGSGFGLLIVKKVLDQLGSNITVHSIAKTDGVIDHGTRFSIFLKNHH